VNFLAHHHLDRGQRDVSPGAWFAAGVAVLDLWPRFRRTAHAGGRLDPLRVRDVAPSSPEGAALRAGLLRHEAVDAAFHGCAAFVGWRGAAPAAPPRRVGRGGLASLLGHVGVELALDRRLLLHDASLGPELYALLEQVPADALEGALVEVGGEAARGFAGTFAGFVAHRHLLAWTSVDAVARSLWHTVRLVGRAPPSAGDLAAFLEEVDALLAASETPVERVPEWLGA
jgi:hypothetical protein